MSLIRNGGFERGNTDFWSTETSGTLEINNTDQKYGNYCGKFTSSGNNDEIILSNDYVAVSPYDLISIAAWVKSDAVHGVYPIFYLYDADYSFVTSVEGIDRWMDGTYMMFNTQISIPLECSYVRFGYRVHNSWYGDVFYFDGAVVNKIDADSSLNGVAILLPMSDITSTGITTDNTIDMRQFSTYYGLLTCEAVSGTSPTLDVMVCEKDPFGDEVQIASFTQVTTATKQRIDLPHAEGNTLYLRYTAGGTDPSFTVGVAVVGKR